MCEECGISFSRDDTRIIIARLVQSTKLVNQNNDSLADLTRILIQKIRDKVSVSDDEIPTFDGDEFCGHKPKSANSPLILIVGDWGQTRFLGKLPGP